MVPSAERMIDLTNDSDDELKCTGSAAISAPRMPPPTNFETQKAPQPSQNKQSRPDYVDRDSPRALSDHTSTISRTTGPKLSTSNNVLNSTWDGFEELRQRKPSGFRTPSPFTQGPSDYNHNTGNSGLSSGERRKKRLRQGSLSMGSKRFRYPSPDITDRGAGIENVNEDVQYDEYLGTPPPRWREATADELDHGVIILDNDDKLDDLIETSNKNWHAISKKKGPRSLNPDYVLIDLDDNEDRLFAEVDMLAPRQSPSPGRQGTIIESRNKPIIPPWVVKESIRTEVGTIKIGDVVELKSSGFLRISIIMANLQSDDVKFRGCRLERARELNGVLPKKINELYFNIEIELDDPRPPMVQGMEEVELGQVSGIRETRMTNQIFPSCSFRETGGYYNDRNSQLYAPCAVRWTFSCKYLTARDRWHNKWDERSVEHLKKEETSRYDSQVLFVSGAKIRSRYRGDTILGGAYPGFEKTEESKLSVTAKTRQNSDKPTVVVIDDEPEVEQLRRSVSVIQVLDENENVNPTNHDRRDVLNRGMSLSHRVINLSNSAAATPPNDGFIGASTPKSSGSAVSKLKIRSPGQKYTYGDCFCGAGGATRGALMAGLRPIWGFDADAHACSSWRMNFPDAVVYEEWADQLIQRGLRSSCLKCDILHLSPPCQYFSPAHTVDGKDDEMNLASLFACGMLLDVAKPRIATLEQTFGIVMLARFQPYFNALIQMFTDRGFSIRWKVCHLQNWGLPQRRQRLIMIAACPGEMLPEFPPFTHADPNRGDGVLPPWASVDSVINNIPRGAPDHDLENSEAKPLNCRPWSGSLIAPRCITTHGGQNYHPSGKRGFTNREYACLQGFPMNHKFTQVNVKKQIGNAVPPCIAKVLFSWIKKILEKADGIQPEDEQADMMHSGNYQTEAIVLD